MGNRIAKHVLTSANVEESVTYYVRDAQGNIMSTYVKTAPSSILSYKVEERHLYGSSRLGIYGEQSEMIGATVSTTYFNHLLGKRSFEGVNHLGNVLTVFSDRKFPQNSGGTVSGFKAELFTSQDYYPFGMLMPGRNFTSENYRFGFNGKETDNQVKGTGAQYDYGFRIYDSRLGKFLSIDPLFQTYPFYTPYQFSGNNPILFIDVDGLERVIKSKSKNQWKCFNSWDIKNSIPRHNLSWDLWKKKPSYKLKPLVDSENSIEPEEKYLERENIQPLKVEGVGIIEIPNNDETLKNKVPNPTLVLPDDVGYTMTFENHEIPPGHNFNFNESIPFKGSSDAFADPQRMKEALSPLANFLNSNPQAQVFVVGNLSAADLPAGHGPEVLNAPRHLNGDPNHTARDVMNARAQAIQNYLIENLGVNPTQIIFGPGNNRTDRATPTTTFQIRNRSNQ